MAVDKDEKVKKLGEKVTKETIPAKTRKKAEVAVIDGSNFEFVMCVRWVSPT